MAATSDKPRTAEPSGDLNSDIHFYQSMTGQTYKTPVNSGNSGFYTETKRMTNKLAERSSHMGKAKPEKKRTALWMETKVLDECDANLESANCRSRSEFIQNAVKFYNGYIHAQNDQDYWCEILTNIIEAMLANTEKHIARLQFKQAVELSKLSHVIAPLCQLNKTEMEELHNKCVNEVKSTNGLIDFDKATKKFRSGEIIWQGDET